MCRRVIDMTVGCRCCLSGTCLLVRMADALTPAGCDRRSTSTCWVCCSGIIATLWRRYSGTSTLMLSVSFMMTMVCVYSSLVCFTNQNIDRMVLLVISGISRAPKFLTERRKRRQNRNSFSCVGFYCCI